MSGATLLMLAPAVPALGAVLVLLAGRSRALAELATVVASVSLAWIVVSLVADVLGGGRPEALLLTIVPGLTIRLAAEPLGALFAATASLLWIANSIYSFGYMRANGEPRQTQFYACFALAIAATMGLALSGNLFTLFLFYEILTLSTYPLVVHRGTPEAMRAGRLYLLMLLGSSTLLLLPAIAWTGILAGTLHFAEGGILDAQASPEILGILLALYVFGTGKAAVMPMHFWLPAAMVAPTPVSALLHAVAVVKAGVFVILKVILSVFGLDLLVATGSGAWLVYVAGFTVIVASLVALREDNLKRRLAYSTVSQLGCVVLAAAMLTPLSVLGAVLHLAAHAVSKITLFFAAGSIYTATHIEKVSNLDGIGRRMPWTMAAFTIGAFSMIGLPLTAGFLSKWFMLAGSYEGGARFAMGVIILSTALNAGYFLPIVYGAFLKPAPADGEHDEAGKGIREAPILIVLALAVTAAATVVLFFLPAVLLDLGEMLVGG